MLFERNRVQQCRKIHCCLNPSFDGICSLSDSYADDVLGIFIRLNPSFDGICSLSMFNGFIMPATSVLILLLMEYAL